MIPAQAEVVGISPGGDHLGPHPWRKIARQEAMAKAEVMIAAYAKAGFTKIHLDASDVMRGRSRHLAG